MLSLHKWLMGHPKTVDGHQPCTMTPQATLAAIDAELAAHSCCGRLLITAWGWLRLARGKAEWRSGMLWNSAWRGSARLPTGFTGAPKAKHSRLTQIFLHLVKLKLNTSHTHQLSGAMGWQKQIFYFSLPFVIFSYRSNLEVKIRTEC